MSAVTAGATNGLTNALNIPASTTSVAARAQNVAVQRGVNVAVSTTIGGEKFSDSVKTNAIEAAHPNLAESAPELAAALKEIPRMSPFVHLGAHTLTGAVTAAAKGESPELGALGGLSGELGGMAFNKIASQNLEPGESVNKETGINVSKLVAGVTGVLATGGSKDVSIAIEAGGRAAEYNTYADQKFMEDRDKIKRAVAEKVIQEGLMSEEEMELNYYNLSLGELAEIVLKNKGIQRGTEPTYFDQYQDNAEYWLAEQYSEMQKARDYYEAGNRDDETVIRTMGIDGIDGSVDLAKAAYKFYKDYKQDHLAETAIYRARNDDLWIDPSSGFGFADLKRFWYQNSTDRDNDLYLVRATKMERPEDFRNLAHGSVRGVIEKDIAEISGAFSKYGARRVGEAIGLAVFDDKKIQIDTGRTFEAVPELVSILMTSGAAGAAKVAGGIEKSASAIARFTKSGAGFREISAAAKQGSVLAERGVVAAVEKAVAKDMSPGVQPKLKRGKNGQVTGVEKTQIHHIVHQSFSNDSFLQKIGYDINQRANRIILPTVEGAPLFTAKRSIHQGPHLTEVKQMINNTLRTVEENATKYGWSNQRSIEEVNKAFAPHRNLLKSGDIPLNKNFQPQAQGQHEDWMMKRLLNNDW